MAPPPVGQPTRQPMLPQASDRPQLVGRGLALEKVPEGEKEELKDLNTALWEDWNIARITRTNDPDSNPDSFESDTREFITIVEFKDGTTGKIIETRNEPNAMGVSGGEVHVSVRLEACTSLGEARVTFGDKLNDFQVSTRQNSALQGFNYTKHYCDGEVAKGTGKRSEYDPLTFNVGTGQWFSRGQEFVPEVTGCTLDTQN